MNDLPSPFWSVPFSQLMEHLRTATTGLTSEEAEERLERLGPNRLKPKKRSDSFSLLLGQFKSPIILVLLSAAVLSIFLHDPTDAAIILFIVLISGLLGFWQERGASNAVARLMAVVQVKTAVSRNGEQREIPVEEVVPGDIVALSGGAIVPGDGVVLESKDFFTDEAALTGETFPTEKVAGILPPEIPLSRRSNSVFMGSHVVSGSAKALIVRTGTETEFGRIAERLKVKLPETGFEIGIRRFGYFLMETTLLLLIVIFAINVFLRRPVMDSFLFSLALAVGLTPQLLPAIIAVNLAQGASQMARRKVIVKRLASIEDFGSMTVLCSDKTGTLTEGTVRVHSALDFQGNHSEKVLFYAFLNALYETGYGNPIDEAIRRDSQFDADGYEKIDEIPYDFIRKRMSVVVSRNGKYILITKGALQNVMSVCEKAETSDGSIVEIEEARKAIEQHFEEYSDQGFRCLGVACREVQRGPETGKMHESEMTFLGFLVLHDPPKRDVLQTVNQLKDLGVSLRIITGDNRLVAKRVSAEIGLQNPSILTSSELAQLSDEALLKHAGNIDIFAEVEPNQKERIILALKKSGHVVGYLGDGINDASALHAADVGISVEGASDAAKNAADIVLLEKELHVLVDGVRGGRKTFANTLKYVFMATSANFGNMFSMAAASAFLPFLPMLPKQILLTNLLTDFPEMTISTDSVDSELIEKPRRWDIRFIQRFMLVFGTLSSAFDFVAFGLFLLVLHASAGEFRTAWFIESVLSASAIVLVIRSRRALFKSIPGKYLVMATIAVMGASLLLPFLPIAKLFGFVPLRTPFFLTIGAIILVYIGAAEATKRLFWRRFGF